MQRTSRPHHISFRAGKGHQKRTGVASGGMKIRVKEWHTVFKEFPRKTISKEGIFVAFSTFLCCCFFWLLLLLGADCPKFAPVCISCCPELWECEPRCKEGTSIKHVGRDLIQRLIRADLLNSRIAVSAWSGAFIIWTVAVGGVARRRHTDVCYNGQKML